MSAPQLIAQPRAVRYTPAQLIAEAASGMAVPTVPNAKEAVDYGEFLAGSIEVAGTAVDDGALHAEALKAEKFSLAVNGSKAQSSRAICACGEA